MKTAVLVCVMVLIVIPTIASATAGGQGKAQGNSCMAQCIGANAESYETSKELTQFCQKECNVGTGQGSCLTIEDGCCVPYTDDPDCEVPIPCGDPTLNPITCLPWGEPGCVDDKDCVEGEYCDYCATSSCPVCDDCIAACLPLP